MSVYGCEKTLPGLRIINRALYGTEAWMLSPVDLSTKTGTKRSAVVTDNLEYTVTYICKTLTEISKSCVYANGTDRPYTIYPKLLHETENTGWILH